MLVKTCLGKFLHRPTVDRIVKDLLIYFLFILNIVMFLFTKVSNIIMYEPNLHKYSFWIDLIQCWTYSEYEVSIAHYCGEGRSGGSTTALVQTNSESQLTANRGSSKVLRTRVSNNNKTLYCILNNLQNCIAIIISLL